MNFRRFLRPQSIELDLKTRATPPGELPEDWDPAGPKNLRRIREEVLEELTGLLAESGEVSSPHKLRKELYERENKALTAIGEGIALPHVRTLQVKSFIMAFGRSSEGLPFGAPDQEPVHLFFAMAAPPYEDRTYLKVYRSLAKTLLSPGAAEEFLSVEEPGLVLRVLNRVGIGA